MSEWVWKPSEQYVESTNVWRFLRKLGFSDREEFLRYSRENLEQFWDAMVKETGIAWFAAYEQVLDQSRGVEWAQWFLGGKLNIAHNCLDRHVSKPNPAMIWEGENGETRTVSFVDLQKETNRLANALRAIGLQKGDRIALCMPMVPEVVSILYAAFKLGVIAVPIFAGFGTHAIATRLHDSGARVVFTADSIERRGKLLPLKQKVDESIKGSSVERVVVLRYRGPSVPLSARDTPYSDLIAGQPDEFETAPLESEDRALILYTSGTTGKPKGTVHTHAGAIAQMSKEIWLAFDHQPNDRFFWLSDIGWMMGPWTIIGNHTFGGTIFLYDGAPDFPAPDRLWRLVERHQITTLGVSPTAIRMLMRRGGELAKGYAMESLRLLGSTGEPWDDTSWLWYFETVGKRRCPVINISGGTEIVGCFLFPLPIQPLKPSTLGGPAPGMAVEVVDESGRPVRGQMGYLVCTRPAPSMTRGVWNDPQRYLDTYWSHWPGVWYHGDWASVDADGCWYLHGRADESMNIAGRKVGPAEVEDALMQHPAVAEAAVIGVPDELRGECIVAFVVLRAEASAASLTEHLVQALGPTFRPKEIYAVKELPKTQSGKVVRRLIRQRYLNEPLGDTSTVENPSALDAFSRHAAPAL